MIRGALIVLSFLSLFLFPWPYAACIVFLAALYVPVAGIAFGLMYDALYWGHGAGMPVATLMGALGSILAFLIQRFVRTRISDFSL